MSMSQNELHYNIYSMIHKEGIGNADPISTDADGYTVWEFVASYDNKLHRFTASEDFDNISWEPDEFKGFEEATKDFIATVYLEDGHYYIGPGLYRDIIAQVNEDLEGFRADDDFYKKITHIYVSDYDSSTSMLKEGDPVWSWSREFEKERKETYPFSLDNGVLKTRKEAVKLVTARLSKSPIGFSLEERKAAAEKVTDPASGRFGYTIGALTRDAWSEAVIARGSKGIPPSFETPTLGNRSMRKSGMNRCKRL